jgi:hypothetical protein
LPSPRVSYGLPKPHCSPEATLAEARTGTVASARKAASSPERPLSLRQAGPTQFDAEDPSDGYVLVNLDVNNGYAIAGAGSVVILQSQALKSGVTPIALNNITFVDNVTAGASTTTSAHEVLVTVE